MKLLECYIENFGKLSAYAHTFSDGLNLITGKNGCGKTTLSVFIKSMLYGIETKKTKGEETDRKRYLPWQRGRCGGSLTFENQGKRYRIERTFGEKPSADAFAIYDLDTGDLTSDFSENVGEELFGIDADGFERTVFLSERKFSVSGNNQTISAKLSNLVGVDGDMGSFNNAIDELEKKEKYYRHRRGKGGLIGDIKAEMSALDIELVDIARKRDICDAAERELSDISLKIKDAESLKSKIEKQRLSDEYRKEYEAKKSTLTSYEQRLEKEKLFFALSLPSHEEIRSYEEKHNKALLMAQSLEAERRLVKQNFNDAIDTIDEYLAALNDPKKVSNVNKSCYFPIFFALFFAICVIFIGATIHPALYLLSCVSLPFIYIGIRNIKKGFTKNCAEDKTEEITLFLFKETHNFPNKEDLHSLLMNMKSEKLAEKKEQQRILQYISSSEQTIKSLTEEYQAFLSKFNLVTEDRFGELRDHLSAYENLIEETAIRSHEAEMYAAERGILPSHQGSNDEGVVSEQAIANADAELRSMRSVRYMLESRLASLYDELAREDELKERQLELTDALTEAEAAHKTALKATEHLILAKERLTSKYLGKMRTAFNSYIERIGQEDGRNFTIDTDFSLKKFENGLTNSINNYSLGTKELYSLAIRLALVDALYENNPPFIVLDDPFCHFDDEKCRAALNAVKRIATDKQIIYLTCSESRTLR